MGSFAHIFKPVVTAFVAVVGFSVPVWAQSADIDALLRDLADPSTENWQAVERQIQAEWEKSGSASMDLLLQRGQKALEAEDYEAALEHFTALTDHAPDFAEGWNGRATALFQMQLYGPALQDIRRTLALNPDHFGAIVGLAVILQETGYPEDALAAWRILERINPHRPEVKEAIERLEKDVGGATL